MNISSALKILAVLLIFTACSSEPKVIESVSASTSSIEGEGTAANASINISPTESDAHEVVVKETLDTDKYTYMNVTEGEKEFWVAVTKRPVEVGATYYFKGGLLKRNFFSREYERTFETLYLVGDLRQKPIGNFEGSGSAVDRALGQMQGSASEGVPVKIEPVEGAVPLSELFGNMEKYSGQKILVTGKVIKVNPMIMGRNWAHIQDGSGNEHDLTITSTDNIPLGHVVSLEGVIALNKDFGAGYRYDIIMEEAVLK